MGLVLKILLPFLVIVIVGTTQLIGAEQVVLLDTTGESTLEWTRFPYGPQANTPGWVEESFTNFQKGINWRSYVVCDVAYKNVNNWLWTPFVDRGVANRIYIEIKFTIRDCSLFPGNAMSCKETFSLLYYEFDAATREPPPWETESYKLIARIAGGEGRFNANSEVNINTEVKSIPVTKKGVYFAFRDEGACISLLAIKVYYITCPEVTINFARFPATSTGKEIPNLEQANGTCMNNSEVIDIPPTYLCKGDGKWTLPTGGCKCKAGFQPDFEKQVCNVCPPATFKADSGDGLCESCPENSKAPSSGYSECKCNNGYYRAAKDPKSMACTQPPSAPQNLTINFVDQSTVILSWNSPQDLGGRVDIFYRIKCDACTFGIVQYTPSSETFNDTKVTVTGLNAVTTYRFQVFAENGVSHLSTKGGPEYTDIVVTTEASVASSIPNVHVTSVKSTEISLVWDAPSIDDVENGIIDSYEVHYFVRNDNDHMNATTVRTTELSTTLTGLQQKTEYGIHVRAKTRQGWGDYSPVIFKTTGQILNTAYVGDDEGILKLRVIAGGIVAIVVTLIVVIVLAVVFIRSRGNDECNKKQPSDCDTLEYRNGEGLVVTYMTTPLFAPIGGASRTYIDPHTYEDPNQAVREFAREIDASCITIEAIIGGGEFGDVCKGKLKINGNNEIDVAIKTLKAGSHEKSRNDFLTEASIMGQFEHPNVIFLQGVVTKSNPVMIITEYMENGSLDTFLRANDGKFQVLQLVGMLRGIASGMQYLSEMNYVHRDLAARNVLVNSQLVCKIADFGLSREIESATEGAYTTRGGKIPVRWTAPEAIAFRKFTSASDVWSMGIVCWEVMSYGERPYWNWSNQDVIKSIEKGYRLPAPMDCPEAIYQLMLDCWQKERTHRPTFQSIVKTLDKLIRVPDTLRKIAQNRIDLLNADEEQDEVQDQARHLDTVRVREVYKASFRDIYIQHRFHKNICRNDTPAADTSAENDLQPGADLAVSFRIYHPFRFIYSTSSSRKIKTNSRTNLKFSHEIVALGSNTLAELRDRIWCSSDHRWCVEIDDAADKDRSEVNPKTVYPSGFFFIDDTFYNDLRDAGSFDYSEIIRQWAQERDIAPLHVSCMSKVRVNELTPRFGYPYVYLHQGNCEHVIVISDAWVLSANDSLSSKQYPTCSGMHQSYTKLCHVCGIESARWICVDSDRLPQDRMLFCDTCFRSYNYNDDGSKIGSFKAYPCIHTNIV